MVVMLLRHFVVPRALCFVFYKDEVLLMKASEKKDWTGTYNPLGGHIEKGENVIDSAEREIREESGLTVTDTKLRVIIHVTDFFGKDVMMFVTESYTDTKDVKSCDEGELEWVKINELSNIKIFEDIKPILKHVLGMNKENIFVGTSKFDGKDKLLALDIKLN